MEKELLSAFAALQNHILGTAKLEAAQIEAHKLTIDKHRDIFGDHDGIIRAAFGLVTAYDETEGPLWIARAGFNRRANPPPNDIHWTIYHVMQNIMDRVYTAENVTRYAELLDGFKFGSAAHFPGNVDPPVDPKATWRVKIDASCPKPFKHGLMHEELPARRPTGAYLAPGTMATVAVPPSMVGKGYGVRVGAHSWDNARKPRVLRLDRSSLVYPIAGTEVQVASPLGGGIYIEVPLRADAGVVEVTIHNAVRSPYFSMKPFHQTTLEEWRNVERDLPAPWADFQTGKFMMQVPASWIRKLDDPITLLKNWDAAMDAMNDLMGLPRRWGKETMYLQVDLQNRSRVFAPGYPTVNDRYDPNKDYSGSVNHYLVRGPQYAPDYVFHEQGHGYGFVKFGGEMESTVNLLHVAVMNQKFGQSLDEAFRGSRNFNQNEHRTLNNTAVAWMTSFNFVNRKPMQPGEKAYQLKGHAKFVDIARLFGWKPLNAFWASWVDDFEAGRPWSKHGTDTDKLNLRLSENAGVDLTPLLHFWGTPPRDAQALQAAVSAENLPPSAKVYDALVHYKSLVPTDNQAFRDFALKWWGTQPSSKGYWTEREHTQQWEAFNEQTSARIQKTVQDIINTYFPNGRPRQMVLRLSSVAAKNPINPKSGEGFVTTTKSVTELQQDFLKLRFGMFIHFNMATYKGVEWVAGYHSPADFDPGGNIDTDAWADAALSAGMAYGVLTVKHVAGFCLWDSQYTTYDVMHPDCPYQQDLVAQFIKSFKSRGLKVGLYYCWRHPGFGDPKKFKVLPPECDPAAHGLEQQIQFQKKQIAELVKKYPDVVYLWNDALDDQIMPAEEAQSFIRSLRPDILSSANWWSWGKKGTPYVDIAVKEMRHFPEENKAPGETCWKLEQNWFWKERARSKTTQQVLHLMTTVLSRHSNFLLNVGPDKNGKIVASSMETLAEIGKLRGRNAVPDRRSNDRKGGEK